MNDVNPSANPLPMKREEKLKIFAVLAVHKDVPQELIKDKIGLLMIAAYGQPEALIATGQTLRQMGLDPNEHVIPHMMVERNAEDMIQIPSPTTAAVVVPRVEKTKEEMCAYVRYVFDKAGISNTTEVSLDDVIEIFMKKKI